MDDEAPTEKKMRLDVLRDLLWRKTVEMGRANKEFGDAIQQMGVFRFIEVIDTVVDQIIELQNEADPLYVQLDEAQSEVARLRSLLAKIAPLVNDALEAVAVSA